MNVVVVGLAVIVPEWTFCNAADCAVAAAALPATCVVFTPEANA
jgi:hypothetical protein